MNRLCPVEALYAAALDGEYVFRLCHRKSLDISRQPFGGKCVKLWKSKMMVLWDKDQKT
jgi:hypothetical protein